MSYFSNDAKQTFVGMKVLQFRWKSLARKRLNQIAFLLALALSVNTTCFAGAADSWQSLKKLGQVADVGGEEDKAIDYYSRALKLIPPTDQNSTIDVEALLATNFAKQYKFDKAAPLTKQVREIVPILKKSKNFDPEILVSVKYLAAAYRSSYDGRLSQPLRLQNFQKYEDLILELEDLVAPNQDEVYARHYDRVRGYIFFGLRDGADKALTKLVATMDHKSPYYQPTVLAQAVMEQSLNRPQLLVKLHKELSTKLSEIELLSAIAKAHLFAANYSEVDKTCDKALALAAAKKPPDVKAQIDILTTYLKADEERGSFAPGEKRARKYVELVAYVNGKKSDEYTRAVKKLIFFLTKNNKLAEAKSLKEKQATSYDWLFEDEQKK